MIAMTAVVIRRSESGRRDKTARICARTVRIHAIAAAKYTPMIVCVFSLLATTVAQARPHSDSRELLQFRSRHCERRKVRQSGAESCTSQAAVRLDRQGG
jgi:hypothetical protein